MLCSATVSSRAAFESSNILERPKKGGTEYTSYMICIYERVIEAGLPNFMGASIPVPTNLNLVAWAKLAVIQKDERVVSFLMYSILAGYEGPVPSPSAVNHASAKAHPRDIALYITMEMEHVAMLGPFDQPTFTQWCQINPLLPHPTKDSSNRIVIMDLSWLLPPAASVNGGMPRDTYLRVHIKKHLPTAQDMAPLHSPSG